MMWLTIAMFVMLALAGCRHGAAASDVRPARTDANATIAGTVRGPEGTTNVDGRVVEVVNVDTFERHRARTDQSGGFLVKVKPGKYRVELVLRDGEALVRQPETLNLDYSGVDDHADFVIGNVRPSRPRPAYRSNDGLGSPIA